MSNVKELTEESEIRRLKRLYTKLPPKRKALADGLIVQAARLRVRLDQLNAKIDEYGLTTYFQQSDKVEGFVKESAEAALFVKMDKNYQSIMKQLTDMLPVEEPKKEKSKLDELAELMHVG